MSRSATTKDLVQFEERLIKQLKYEPTAGQKHLANAMSRFVYSDKGKLTFVLKGYAGTGKTTFISALVKVLPQIKMKSVLLAPTGRAAKVMQAYSGRLASTIHRKIYFSESTPHGVRFSLAKNKHKNTIFLVDEASMISTDLGIGPITDHDLLTDLVEYVFQGENCRLILVGDVAQLPPVGLEISPALDIKYLRQGLGLTAGFVELTEVVRQAEGSGILQNATMLRQAIGAAEFEMPVFQTMADVKRITGYELQDELESAYGKYGMENCVFICRSNKSANGFGQQVRSRILFHEEELNAGELLMVVKNNYTWPVENGKPGLIANGDMLRVNKILKEERKWGFHFIDVLADLSLDEKDSEIEVKLLMDSVMAKGPSLPRTRMQELFTAVEQNYMHINNRGLRKKKVFEDPYYNALQVKMAYAVTCHKAQGGQWPAVFIDQGYLKEDVLNDEYLRWLYTAFTRASEQVYLVNFGNAFFPPE